MPLLDVTELLVDPDFVSLNLVCERNAQSVTSGGLGQNTVTLIPFSGVVTAGSGDVLNRRDSGEYIVGNITINTKFTLRDGTSGYTADIVQWNGSRYTVSMVGDYTTFGAGFVRASCDLIPLAG